MIRWFAILVMTLWTSTGGQGQSTNNEVRIRATVKVVAPLTSFSGTITPVGVDPRFALTLRIESAAPTVANFGAGAVVTLGIHSPSQLYGGESPKGKMYDFVLHRTMEGGKLRYFALTALKVAASWRWGATYSDMEGNSSPRLETWQCHAPMPG